MPNKSVVTNAFGDLMRFVYRNYSGVLIEKRSDGYWVKSLKTLYPTYDDACYGIDKFKKEFIEDIKRQNPHLCQKKS
jgi:hypothetical protein